MPSRIASWIFPGSFVLSVIAGGAASVAATAQEIEDAHSEQSWHGGGISVPGAGLLEKGDWHVYANEGLRIDSPEGKVRLKFNASLLGDAGYIGADQALERAFPGLTGWDAVVRQARLTLRGWIYDVVDFKFQYEFSSPPEVKDAWIGFKPIPVIGRIRAGNMKEPFSLEGLTGSTDTTFLERGLPTLAFFPSRNIGAMTHNTAFEQRMTWALGGFRNTASFSNLGDANDSFDDAIGYDLTARITGVPLYADRGSRLLHLGLSLSHSILNDSGSQSNAQVSPRPETYLTNDRLVNTGKFGLDGQNKINPELAIVSGPLSLQGEYSLALLDAPQLGNPSLWGFYVFASYLLTGETRRYDPAEGVFVGVQPKRNFDWGKGGWGAWELALRLSYLDLNDAGLAGGEELNVTAGLNWYLDRRTRLMFNYVHAQVRDRLSAPAVADGRSDILQARLQLLF